MRLRCGGRETACRLVIFDKDGTLIEFHSLWVPVVRARARFIVEEAKANGTLEPALLRAFGYDPDSGRIDPRGPLALAPRTETSVIGATVLYGAGLPWEDAMAAVRRAYRRADEAVDPVRDARALPDLGPTLARLRAAGARLAVATTDTTTQARRGLEALGVAGLFDTIVGADAVSLTKPHPEMVLQLCERLRVAPGEAVVVGDGVADMLMAREAGVALAIGVVTGITPEPDLRAHADVVIGSLSELTCAPEGG